MRAQAHTTASPPRFFTLAGDISARLAERMDGLAPASAAAAVPLSFAGVGPSSLGLPGEPAGVWGGFSVGVTEEHTRDN